MDTWAGLHVFNRTLEAAPLVPFACAWVRRHHLPLAFRPIYYYVGARVLLYFLDIFSRAVLRNNVYLYHAATVLLVACFAAAYWHLLPARWHGLLRLGLGLFGPVALADALVLNGFFTDVNTFAQSVGGALLLVFALLHLLHLTRQAARRQLESTPEFFLSMAVLVYCSCSIVVAVALNLVYHAGYATGRLIQLDTLLSTPDVVLLALQMGLLAWVFRFFPLSVSPRRALPVWLHYSAWPTTLSWPSNSAARRRTGPQARAPVPGYLPRP